MPWLSRAGKDFPLPEPRVGADPDGWERMLREHLLFSRQRQYSEHTLAGRPFYLKRFTEWCAERSLLRPRTSPVTTWSATASTSRRLCSSFELRPRIVHLS